MLGNDLISLPAGGRCCISTGWALPSSQRSARTLGLAFIIPSPKQQDLRRDGRFAMHSFPCPDNEDAFYVRGRVTVVGDPALREHLGKQFVDERSQFGAVLPADADALFEFEIERCLLTKTTGHGDPNPQHVVWKPPESQDGAA